MGIDDTDAIEEESDSNSNSGSEESKSDDEGTSTDAATNADSQATSHLSLAQKKAIAGYVSESFWINF